MRRLSIAIIGAIVSVVLSCLAALGVLGLLSDWYSDYLEID